MDDIRPCISCHGACRPLGNLNGKGTDFDLSHIEMGHCVLNPWTFNEEKYRLDKTTKPLHIAVIGGGIGGMEFAIEASKRGHTVDLYEKTDHFGGVFNAAAAPSFKEKDRELLKWYEKKLRESSTRIHLNTEVKNLKDIQADEYVIATGSVTRHLSLKGAERSITALDYLYGLKEVKGKVAVIGGGLTGCEIAYDLALKGYEVSVIEMMDSLVGAKGICSANSTMLRDLLDYHKVNKYLSAKTKEITKDAVIIEAEGKVISVPADTVITSIGYNSDKTFAPDPKDKKTNIHLIGDCDHVGSLKTVIKQAYELAQELSYRK